jgi:hypothetical protein
MFGFNELDASKLLRRPLNAWILVRGYSAVMTKTNAGTCVTEEAIGGVVLWYGPVELTSRG